MSLLAVLGLVLAGVFVAPAAAQAAPAKPNCAPVADAITGQSSNSRAKTVNDAIVAMLQQGKSDAEIATSLKANLGVETKTTPAGAGVSPLSTGNNISLYAPQILYDSCGGGWYVYAHYAWDNLQTLMNDKSIICNNPCAIGGTDGFGITLNRAVNSTSGYFMNTWGTTSYYPVSTGRTWAQDANTTGAAFEGQDKVCVGGAGYCANTDYSFFYGEEFYDISSIGCGSLQAFSKYFHDWSNTTITGLSVGPWSIGVQWSSGSNQWSRASGPSNAVTPC